MIKSHAHIRKEKEAAFFPFECASQNIEQTQSCSADERGRECYVMHWYTKCSVERGLTFSQRDNNETLRATEDDNDRKEKIVSLL